MKEISLDNGANFMTAAEAIEELKSEDCVITFDTIVNAMDDDVRERVHMELAPCTDEKFLIRYLELAEDDLIIG